MRAFGPVLAIAILVLLVISGSVYTVDQRQNAIVFQLGEVKDVVTKPGLHFKLPLIQNVRQYYVSVQGDEFRAQTRIRQTVSGTLRDEFGIRGVHEVVSGEREQIMARVREKVDQDLKRIGVGIIDVRLKRVDLPAEVSESVYRRMEAERKRIANELRSTGGAEGEKIRADADRQREVILAEAYRDAQRVRGDGDAKSAGIYAAAFSQNPEFFAFYRSMEAYRSTFRGRNDIMLLETNSDFLRYFRDSLGRQASPRK